MKTMTVGDLKKDFSKVAEGVKLGNKYAISYGKTKKKFAVIMPFDQYTSKKRKLGVLKGKSKVITIAIIPFFQLLVKYLTNIPQAKEEIIIVMIITKIIRVI